MLKILSYLKSYKKSIYIALFLMVIELLIELWHPLIIAKIIDDGILKNDLSVVIYWGSIMIALTAIGFAAGIVNSFYAAYVSQGFGYDVRKSLFEKVQAFTFTNLNQFPTSSLITRLTNDVSQIQGLVFMGLRIMARAPLLIIGGILMALFINWKLALILVCTMPILLIFLLWLMRRGVNLFRLVQVRLDKVNSVMRENLTGMRLIRAFNRKNYEQNRFAKASHELKDETMNALRLIELTMPILLLVMNISILLILWFGSFQVIEGEAQVGEIVALVNYATRIMFAFSVFSFILMNLTRAKASSARIVEILDEKIDIEDGATSFEKSLKGTITFQNVSFHYPNTKEDVIKDVSFQVKAGETVAILGATGSGKTTIFQLIPRLYEPTEGRIMIDNSNINELKIKYLRKQIGYVPQEARLFSGTIRENISWGKEEATLEEIIEAAKKAQIHETIEKFPNQYETIIGQKGVNLSGGQKQRIAIARALIRKPTILLLDDSTSALDLKTESELLKALDRLSCTTIIITQKISTVQHADQILIFDEGQIVAKGNHDLLISSCDLYQKIYLSQYGAEVAEHE